MTLEQKQSLPYDLVRKLNKPHQLNFFEKAYIYSVAYKKEGYFLMPPLDGDEERLTLNDFIKLKKEELETIENAEYLLDNIGFVLSTADLIETSAKAHLLSVSPASKYVIKSRNQPKRLRNDQEAHKEHVKYITDLLSNYDGMKLRLISDNDISITQWYILMYMYDQKEKPLKPILEKFKFAVGGSQRAFYNSFPKLVHKGLLEKTNKAKRKGALYKITIKGMNFYNETLAKYITNF
ncbi:MAG: hypothetical protein AABY22_25705 [Nanoarchaeota archaeon]